jgi:hypothetical protein
MTVGFNRLFGVDKIKARIGNQNLVISFNYPEDSLEKVAYDKDPQNQKFHLTIEPKAGFEPLDTSNVEYSYTGSNADLIFIVGATSLEDLGSLYQQEKKLLDDKQKAIVNISSNEKSGQLGTVNLYDPTVSGVCEILVNVLQALNLPIEQDIATNLLSGIESATQNLQNVTQADTYEMVASLMRLGAKKGHLNPVGSNLRSMPGFGSAPTGTSNRLSPFSGLTTQPNFGGSLSQTLPSTPVNPTPSTQNQSSNAVTDNQQSTTDQSGPSPDWLKPKVFKSGGSQV